MVVDQIAGHGHRQLIRRDGVRQRRALRVAFGVQMLHVFQIRAVTADAHVQAVADVDGVDGARVDLAELRDLLLQAFVRLVGVAGGALAGTEVEVGEPVAAGFLAVGDAVKAVFHLGGELVVDQLGEVRLEQLGHGEGEPAGDQRTATLVYVTAIHDCGDNARVSGRATDLLGFQRLDQRGLGVAGRRLGFMAVRFDVACLDLPADAHRRQGGVGFGGVTPDGLGVRLAGGSSLVRASPSAGSGGLGLAPLPRGLHKAGEFDDGAGRLEHGLALGGAGRRRQAHGGGGTGGVSHLAGKRALPDQRV